MIVLGISGLPAAQEHLKRTTPGLSSLDERNAQGNDSAACLVVDGRVVAAAAEERFSGVKATGRLPLGAIAYCLAEAGITPDRVDRIAHGFDYDRHRRVFFASKDYLDTVLSGRTVVDGLTEAGWSDVAARFRPVEHHVAHAASAYLPSGFGSALCVVSDGMGEVESLTVHQATGGTLKKLHTQPISDSLGILYSVCTRFLGFASNSDEYKVMGLAAYGDPTRYAGLFADLVRFDPEHGGIRVDWPRGALTDPGLGYPKAVAHLESLAFPRGVQDGEVPAEHADFAAALQARHTEVLRELVAHWLAVTGEDSLCLAGGTFLNCKSNQVLCELPEVRRAFVQPAAGDDGTALGAALFVANEESSLPPVEADFDPYLGPGYTEEEVRAELESFGPAVRWEHLGRTEEYFAAAAADLAADRIIAWFHDRMEFGPRALGNRSILGRPDGERIKDRINSLVKFREPFRPFAPAVAEEDCHGLFTTRALSPTRYMLCTAWVRPERQDAVSGIVHADGSARVQVVTRESNPAFWRLLGHVRTHTGHACLVNTSFNVKGQPLIMAPRTAVETFLRTALDRLYIEGFVVSRA